MAWIPCMVGDNHTATLDRGLPGALIAWPTLEDQPMWCSRGLRMWHQKSKTTFSGASLWSSYTSCRRPPTFDLMTATRVRLTYLGSTTSTRMPDLKEFLMLSASWEENNKRTIQWRWLTDASCCTKGSFIFMPSIYTSAELRKALCTSQHVVLP